MRFCAFLCVILLGLLTGCRATYPRRDPTGEVFPSVAGSALSGDAMRVPDAFRGRTVLLFVGYEQEAQFDIDRWLLGLTQSRVDVPVYELPTIPGLLPGLFAGHIDAGMRRGIPREDWASVITIYDDGEAVARFTGNEDGLTGRVILLDPAGRVVFYHDRGYSTAMLAKLIDAVRALRSHDEEVGGAKSSG